MKKGIKGNIIVTGLALVAFAVGIICFFNITDLIISIGYTTAHILAWALLAVGTLLILGGNAIFIDMRNKLKPKPVPAPAPVSKEQRETPEYVVNELKALYPQRPRLIDEINECLSQLQSIDRKQEKLAGLLARVDEGALTEVVSTVDDTEHIIVKNISHIINRMTIWDPAEAGDPDKADIYAAHRSYIKKYLDRNKEILNKVDILLGETVSYIDSKDDDTGDDVGLVSMTDAIRSLRTITEDE